jgi:quercetin dioxygenase-like cupin family protein
LLSRSRFTHGRDVSVIELHTLEGRPLRIPVKIRELLWGDRAVLAEMSVPAGFESEPHAHDHESFVYVVSGLIRASVGGETRELEPGDAVLHPAGEAHSIEALSDARWIEIKAPANPTWPTQGSDA